MECKKCNRDLPDDYKYKLCEQCRGKRAEALKKALVSTTGVIIAVGSAVATVLVSIAQKDSNSNESNN